jgi:Mrp family chromosome partitioning ATPase/capsular polysaccharide biosynthesis protein
MTSNTDMIAPPSLLASLRRSWLLFGLIAVLIAALAAGLSSLRPERYQARAEMSLALPGATTLFRSANSRDLGPHLLDEADRVRSTAVTSVVADRIGQGLTATDIQSAIVVTPNLDRSAIAITARADSPELAARIANLTTVAYQQDVIEAEQERLDTVVSRLDDEVAGLQATADTAQTELDELRAEVESDLASLPAEERIRLATAQIAVDPRAQALQRRRDDALADVSSLRAEIRRLRIDTSLFGTGVERVETADAPRVPYQPKPLRDGIIGGALGVALAAAFVWARAERTPRSLRSRDVALLLGTRTVAAVPAQSRDPVSDAALVPTYDAALAAIGYGLHTTGGSTLLVVGANHGDGATVTALNLALAGVRDGMRVVVIDAHVGAPGLTRRFGLDRSRGWSDLGEGAPIAPAVHIAATAVGDLSVVPVGVRGRSLTSVDRTSLSAVIHRAAAIADLVIVDAAPLLTDSDASTLSTWIDGVVVVVAAGVDASTLEQVRWRLDILSAPVLGCVVNAAGGRRRGRRARTGAADDIALTTTPAEPEILVDDSDAPAPRVPAAKGRR